MNNLVDIILQHKEDFKRYYPLPAFNDLLVLREKENISPTPEGLSRLAIETMDLVISGDELPQYLAFMDVFHSDVLARISSDSRQQFIALTKYFLLQFPRSVYVKLAKTNPNIENQKLRDKYHREFSQANTPLKNIPFPTKDVEEWIRTMFTLHQKYEQVVDEATPYLTSFRGGLFNVFKAMEDGSLDKVRYDRELIVSHRYSKSVPYFMNDGNMHACYGQDFIGPFGIFYHVSEKCSRLLSELKKAHNVY